MGKSIADIYASYSLTLYKITEIIRERTIRTFPISYKIESNIPRMK